MKKQFYYFLLTAVLGLSIIACQSTRQTDVSVNTSASESNTKKVQTKPEAGQATSANSSETAKTEKKENPDRQKDKRDDSLDAESGDKIENRCGWYENPTPGNHWLTDKDGEWTIGVQGGHQAEGDYPPEFSDDQWVNTNINYGYGCACLRVKTDKKNKYITEVVSATAKPLSACRKDKSLKEPKD